MDDDYSLEDIDLEDIKYALLSIGTKSVLVLAMSLATFSDMPTDLTDYLRDLIRF